MRPEHLATAGAAGMGRAIARWIPLGLAAALLAQGAVCIPAVALADEGAAPTPAAQPAAEATPAAAPPADEGAGAPSPEDADPQAAEPTPTVEPTPAEDPQSSPLVDGFVKTRYRLRASGEDHDQDLYQYLRLDVLRVGSNHVTAHLYGRATLDLEGDGSPEGAYVFDSITDTGDSAADLRLYTAYVDAARLGPVGLLRAGRQLSWDGPVFLYFDGARVETRAFRAAAGLKAGALGGVPVHLFEEGASGDRIYGGFVEARPWSGARLRVFGLHISDEQVYGPHQDTYLATTLWQHLGEGVDLSAEHTFLNWSSRSVEVRGSYLRPQWDLLVQGSAYVQLRTLADYAIEFDPYYVSMRSLYPYWQGRLVASKGIAERFGASGGAALRKLVYPQLASEFNHQLVQGWLTGTMRDVGLEGLSVDVTGEVWDSLSREEATFTVGGDVRYRPGDGLDVMLGTAYALYKYDFYSDTELSDVRTWFGRARYPLIDRLVGELSYTYEDAASRRFHTVNISVRYDL